MQNLFGIFMKSLHSHEIIRVTLGWLWKESVMCGCMLMHAVMNHNEHQHTSETAPVASAVSAVSEQKCNQCNFPLQANFAFCPNCGMNLRETKCLACGQKLDSSWKTCAYCGSPLGQVAGQPMPSWLRNSISCKVKELKEEMNKNKINWPVVAVTTIVALLVIQVVLSLLGGWRYGGWGMMGRGMMGGWGFSPFGWIGMILMWLIPVGLVVLVVLGITWLVQNVGKGTSLPTNTCPSCGYRVQNEWHNCPNCGTSLSK